MPFTNLIKLFPTAHVNLLVFSGLHPSFSFLHNILFCAPDHRCECLALLWLNRLYPQPFHVPFYRQYRPSVIKSLCFRKRQHFGFFLPSIYNINLLTCGISGLYLAMVTLPLTTCHCKCFTVDNVP